LLFASSFLPPALHCFARHERGRVLKWWRRRRRLASKMLGLKLVCRYRAALQFRKSKALQLGRVVKSKKE
jgi:hypothetical protein